MVERKFETQCIGKVKTIHTDHAFASAKCSKTVIGEPAIAHKQASRPRRFLLELSLKSMQVRDSRRRFLPLGLNQISFALKHKAPIDLFAF